MWCGPFRGLLSSGDSDLGHCLVAGCEKGVKWLACCRRVVTGEEAADSGGAWWGQGRDPHFPLTHRTPGTAYPLSSLHPVSSRELWVYRAQYNKGARWRLGPRSCARLLRPRLGDVLACGGTPRAGSPGSDQNETGGQAASSCRSG